MVNRDTDKNICLVRGKFNKYDGAINELMHKLKTSPSLNSVILYGSYNKNSFIDGWSDIDLMIVLEENIDGKEFIKLSNKINEIQGKYDINLSVNTILLSEVQLPTFGKPLIYIKELSEGRLLYGKRNPFENCFIPDEEAIRQNSIDNLMTIVGESRRLIRKIRNNDTDSSYRTILRLGIKYCTFTMKRYCEIETARFCMTQNDMFSEFQRLFPEESFNARDILNIRENWWNLQRKEDILNKINQCIGFVEKVWNRIHKDILSKTEYPKVEEIVRLTLSGKKELFGINYRLENTIRVYNMCQRLINDLCNHSIDKDVILLSALTHNLYKIQREKSDTLTSNSVEFVKTLLINDFSEEKIIKIARIVDAYKEYIKNKDQTIDIEAKIFVDAYLLDRIGYVGGVVKTLFVGREINRSAIKSAKYYIKNKETFLKYKDSLYLDVSIKIAEERNKRALNFWKTIEEEYNAIK